METYETYIGLEPFGVLIDPSPKLERLVSQARNLRDLPDEEKFDATKRLALGSMTNAYEEWKTNPNEERRNFYGDIVFNQHPLSHALENEAGCCRYQGALFFTLGYEADLGESHFLQQAPVDPIALENGEMRSVFNDVFIDGRLRHVSIFKDSLKNPSLDYSISNPRVFDSAIGFPFPRDNPCPPIDNFGNRLYSYHRIPSGLVIVSEDSKHVVVDGSLSGRPTKS